MTGTCEGRIALVTGASRGLGKSIAERLASEGAAVAITARTLDRGGRYDDDPGSQLTLPLFSSVGAPFCSRAVNQQSTVRGFPGVNVTGGVNPLTVSRLSNPSPDTTSAAEGVPLAVRPPL